MNTSATQDWKTMNPEDARERRNAIYRLRAWIQAREHAARRPDVVEFRTRHLPEGKTLPVDEAALLDWFITVSEIPVVEPPVDESPPLTPRWLRALAAQRPASGLLTMTYSIWIDVPGRDPGSEAMEFQIPGQGDHPLIQLRSLAATLAEFYGWEEPSAAAWVLMDGYNPRPQGVSVWLERRPDLDVDQAADHSIEFLSLRVRAPADTPPHLILYEIQRVQDEIAGKYRYPVPSSARPYQDGTLEAVRFALARNDGRSWLEIVREWNEGHPDSEFPATVDGATMLGTVVRRCYQQVMGRKLEWARKPGKASRHD